MNINNWAPQSELSGQKEFEAVNSSSAVDIARKKALETLEKPWSSITSTAIPISEIKDIFLASGFVSMDANGIFIDINTAFSSEKLRKLLDRTVFSIAQSPLSDEEGNYKVVAHPNAYLVGCDYQKISTLLYEDQKVQDAKIKIADYIELFNPNDTWWYQEKGRRDTQQEHYISEVHYVFDKIEEEVDDTARPIVDPTSKEIIWYRKKMVPRERNPDIMIALLWTHQIQYGINEVALKTPVTALQETRLIAKSRLPVEGERFKIDFQPCTIINKKPKIDTNGKAILWETDVSVPEVNIEDVLVIEKFPSPWKTGISITWEILEPKPISRLSSLEKMAGEGIDFRTNHTLWEWQLVARKNGFFQKDPKTGICFISNEIHRWEGTFKNTGGRTTVTQASESADIFDFLDTPQKRNTIKCRGDINTPASGRQEYVTIKKWVVAISGDILVGGNVGTKTHLFAMEWNITIGESSVLAKWMQAGWVVMNESVLRARHGTIQCERSEMSTLIGKNIIVKNAKNSLIIGENISIEKAEGCIIICTKTANIGTMKESMNYASTFLFSPPNNPENEEKYLRALAERIKLVAETEELIKLCKKDVIELQRAYKVIEPHKEKIPGIQQKINKKESLTSEEKALIRICGEYQKRNAPYIENQSKITLNKERISTLDLEIKNYEESISGCGYSITSCEDTGVIHCDVSISGRSPINGPRVYNPEKSGQEKDFGVDERIYIEHQESRLSYWEWMTMKNYYLLNGKTIPSASEHHYTLEPPKIP